MLCTSLAAPNLLEDMQEGPLRQVRCGEECNKPIHHLWGELPHGTRRVERHSKHSLFTPPLLGHPKPPGTKQFFSEGRGTAVSLARAPGGLGITALSGNKAFRYQTLGVIISVPVHCAHARVRVWVMLTRIPEAECVRRGQTGALGLVIAMGLVSAVRALGQYPGKKWDCHYCVVYPYVLVYASDLALHHQSVKNTLRKKYWQRFLPEHEVLADAEISNWPRKDEKNN